MYKGQIYVQVHRNDRMNSNPYNICIEMHIAIWRADWSARCDKLCVELWRTQNENWTRTRVQTLRSSWLQTVPTLDHHVHQSSHYVNFTSWNLVQQVESHCLQIRNNLSLNLLLDLIIFKGELFLKVNFTTKLILIQVDWRTNWVSSFYLEPGW